MRSKGPPTRLSECENVLGAMYFVAERKNELTGLKGLATVVVAQAAVDYIAARGKEWRSAEAFLMSKDCRRIVEARGVEYRWPCEGLERFR